MIYAYIRVSTDRQTTENQRFEITTYCENNNIKIDKWINETISGSKQPEDRKLGKILKKMKKDDILLCTELSRLGRDVFMITSILNYCIKREIQIWTIKEKYRLGKDIICKLFAFGFGISAEIERELIRQRTLETMARLKAIGVKLGRPVGSKSKNKKLSGKENIILEMRNKKMLWSEIAKKLKVSKRTLSYFIAESKIFNKK